MTPDSYFLEMAGSHIQVSVIIGIVQIRFFIQAHLCISLKSISLFIIVQLSKY